MNAIIVSLQVEKSPTRVLVLALASLSILLVLTEDSLTKCLVAVVAAYASISVAAERTLPRVDTVSHLRIERDVVFAGESFTISIDRVFWALPIVEIPRIELEGGRGILILETKTRVEQGYLGMDIVVAGRVGTHKIRGISLYIKLKALAITLRASLGVDVVVRVVPRLAEAAVSPSAGAPYDIGLSNVGRAGPGTQFYMSREYRPGDDLKRVDWKASSRTGKLAVKTFEREVYRRVIFVLPITERYLRRASNSLDLLVGELAKIVMKLIRYGTEVIVVVVSQSLTPLPAFVRVRSSDDLACLAEYFSHILWDRESRGDYLEYRSALWASVKLLTETVTGRSIVTYLGEPESDVDVIAGRIVADIVKRLGHEPVFVLIAPEVIRITYGEASTEDFIDLLRISKIPLSELSLSAKVVYFYSEDLLRLLLHAISV